MQAHPFIVLCGVDQDNKPVATHVPCLLEMRDGRIFLLAHVMKKQRHTTAFASNSNVLAIFQGPHSYVSASWYQDPKIGSTWNYQAVHASGTLRFLSEPELHDVLVRLTDKFENNPHSPSLVHRLSPQYVESMMKAIVALEVEIHELEHVFKLSQNRDKKSYDNIIGHLNEGDPEAKMVAGIMQDRKDKVWPTLEE